MFSHTLSESLISSGRSGYSKDSLTHTLDTRLQEMTLPFMHPHVQFETHLEFDHGTTHRFVSQRSAYGTLLCFHTQLWKSFFHLDSGSCVMNHIYLRWWLLRYVTHLFFKLPHRPAQHLQWQFGKTHSLSFPSPRLVSQSSGCGPLLVLPDLYSEIASSVMKHAVSEQLHSLWNGASDFQHMSLSLCFCTYIWKC